MSTRDRRLLSAAEVTEKTGLTRYQIYRREKQGNFPQKRVISANRVAWLSDEVDAWIDNLPTGQTQDQGARRASQAA